MKPTLLFLNGEWSNAIAKLDLSQFSQTICADGAVSAFIAQFQTCPDLILGDGDSLKQAIQANQIDTKWLTKLNWIETPDQDYTDFEKILRYLSATSVQQITIYGATGCEVDHFLGNIAVAKQFYKRFELTFYDDYSCFFFVQSPFKIALNKGTIFSIIPINDVKGLSLSGAQYLPQTQLFFGAAMSLRNQTIADELQGSFDSGDLLIVISLRSV